MHSTHPANWETLKKVREMEDPKLKVGAFMKPEIQLRPYQKKGVMNMLLTTQMILGDGAGLGKTLQAINAFAIWKEKVPDAKLLIVTLKSSAPQWGEEMEKFTTGLTWRVVLNKYKRSGAKKTLIGKEARIAQYEDFKDADVLVVHYATAREDFDRIIAARLPTYMVVFDEIQECKNHKSMNFEVACQIADQATRKYGMSATPIKNRLVEFFYLFKIIVPHLFKNVTQFKKDYTIEELQWIPMKGTMKRVPKVVGYKNLMDFKNKVEPYFLVRRTRDVAKELPHLMSKKAVIEMTAAQKKLTAEAKSGLVYERRFREKFYSFREEYDALLHPTEAQTIKYFELLEKFEALSTKEGRQNAKGAALAFCQMVANGPQWIDEEGTSAKLEEFTRVMEDELDGENVIVYTRFESGIKYLQEAMKKIGRESVKISGAEDDEQRRSARMRFQDPEDPVNVIFITQAGSAALNLQSASVVLFYDTPWSFGDLYQIIGRAQRIGSTHEHILVYHMVCEGSIDEHVLALLSSKKDLSDEVIGDIAEGALSFGGKDEVALGQDGESMQDALYRAMFG